MPQKDTGTDMSEVRDEMDALQGDPAERMSEMQDEIMGYSSDEDDEIEESEISPEQAKFRVMISDYGAMENDDLYVEYFSSFSDAVADYNSVCESDFIKHYDRASVMVTLSKAYRGLSQVFWEVIKKNILFDDGE